MKKYVVSICMSVICVMVLLTVTGYAQVPRKINYQGFLTDEMGIPVDKELEMTFAIYDAPAGGTKLWSETQNVDVDEGRYSVILGEINPIDVTEAQPYWLGITVESDPEMTPRVEITSAMYALFADSVEDFTTDAHNTFAGREAGYNNDTGNFNTFIGRDAGHDNTTGNSNTFIGYEAGKDTTAGYNTFVGTRAGRYNEEGLRNTFIGKDAGYTNVDGDYNTFLGWYAGRANTSDYNTFIGERAGRYNSSGSGNIFMGSRAGYRNESGRDNVFIGKDAGYRNESGHGNTFIGDRAGRNNNQGASEGRGSNNTFIGRNAGYTNELGYYNTFIGADAGYENSDGYFNTYMGQGAGHHNMGTGNTFVGFHAGYNSGGSRNVFLGQLAGYNETHSHRLYIDVSDTDTPLIYGRFDTDLVRINGNLQYTGVLTDVSDGRLKDVQGAFTPGLDTIAQLQPVRYRFKTENPLDLPCDQDYVGVIAQDVQAVLPEAIEEDEDGYLLLNNEPILWSMLNAIKEMKAQNDAAIKELKAENDALREELNMLKETFGQ